VFEIKWTTHERMWAETQRCFRDIQGIDEVINLQKQIFQYSNDDVCFGDAQIDGLGYPPTHDRFTVFIAYNWGEKIIHYVFDFFEPEIHYFDIEFNTHWIDDVVIQRNADNKYSISFGTGECDFRYSYARVNRCWMD